VGYEIKDEAREIREGRWSPSGFCAVSTLEVRSVSLSLSHSSPRSEDLALSKR
jgi:hypothetical protein